MFKIRRNIAIIPEQVEGGSRSTVGIRGHRRANEGVSSRAVHPTQRRERNARQLPTSHQCSLGSHAVLTERIRSLQRTDRHGEHWRKIQRNLGMPRARYSYFVRSRKIIGDESALH